MNGATVSMRAHSPDTRSTSAPLPIAPAALIAIAK
jgi:hypothetical protein